jgi:UDP:flavonoid glycosyltransferase YjiC (YdhE family)
LEHAKSASALVHHGVQDVTQRCISLGRPQLLVPWTREQELLNYMVAWMSFSWMKPPTISVDEMAMTCRDLLRDASLMVAAQHYARQLAQTDIDDALPAIVAGIEERVRSSTQP